MRRPAHLCCLSVMVLAMTLTSAVRTSATSTGGWEWPLDPVPRVVSGFVPPDSPYGPGHRGVDLAGSAGQPVLSVADGTVAYAGSVGGRGVVVIDHGQLTSTYQPVTPAIARGASVATGTLIGRLETVGSHCLPAACLHLGAKLGDQYLDPLALLPARPVRLKPLGGTSERGERGRPSGPLLPTLPLLPALPTMPALSALPAALQPSWCEGSPWPPGQARGWAC